MTEPEIIVSLLDKEWEIPDGFFYKARQGLVDKDGFRRVIHALSKAESYVEARKSPDIERSLVSALWYIPLYMSWQTERIEKKWRK